jgi:hypothetical protein
MSELFSPLYSVELDSVLDPASVTDQYDRFDRGQITMDDFFNKIVRGEQEEVYFIKDSKKSEKLQCMNTKWQKRPNGSCSNTFWLTYDLFIRNREKVEQGDYTLTLNRKIGKENKKVKLKGTKKLSILSAYEWARSNLVDLINLQMGEDFTDNQKIVGLFEKMMEKQRKMFGILDDRDIKDYIQDVWGLSVKTLGDKIKKKGTEAAKSAKGFADQVVADAKHTAQDFADQVVTDAKHTAKGLGDKVVIDAKHTAKVFGDKTTDFLTSNNTAFSSKKRELENKMSEPGFRTEMDETEIVMYPDIPVGSLIQVPLHSQEDLTEIARLSKMSFSVLYGEYVLSIGELVSEVTEIDVIIKHNGGSIENAMKDIASVIVTSNSEPFEGKLTHVLCQVKENGYIHPFFGIDPRLLSNVYIIPLLKPTDNICEKVNEKGLFKNTRDDRELKGCPQISPTVSPPISPTVSPPISPTVSPPISPTVSPPISPTVSSLSYPYWRIEGVRDNIPYAQKLLKKIMDIDTDILRLITPGNLKSISCMVADNTVDLLEMTIQPLGKLNQIVDSEEIPTREIVKRAKDSITTSIGDYGKGIDEPVTGYFRSLKETLEDPKPRVGLRCDLDKSPERTTELVKILELFYDPEDIFSFLGIDEEWKEMYEGLKYGLDKIITQIDYEDFSNMINDIILQKEKKNKEIEEKASQIVDQEGNVSRIVGEIKSRQKDVQTAAPPSMNLSETQQKQIDGIMENIKQVQYGGGLMNWIRQAFGSPRPIFATEKETQEYIDFITEESVKLLEKKGNKEELEEIITKLNEELETLIEELKKIDQEYQTQLDSPEGRVFIEKNEKTNILIVELLNNHNDYIDNIQELTEKIKETLQIPEDFQEEFYLQFVKKCRLVFGDAYIGLYDFLTHIPEMSGGSKVKRKNKKKRTKRTKRTNTKRTNNKRTKRTNNKRTKRTNNKRTNNKRTKRTTNNRKRTNNKRTKRNKRTNNKRSNRKQRDNNSFR